MLDKKFNATQYKNQFQKEKYDRLIVNVSKGKKEIIQKFAKDKGLSLNAFVVGLIEKAMESNKDEIKV